MTKLYNQLFGVKRKFVGKSSLGHPQVSVRKLTKARPKSDKAKYLIQ